MPIELRSCLLCKGNFTPTLKRRKYCSVVCSSVAQKMNLKEKSRSRTLARNEQRAKRARPCAICAAPILPINVFHKYCSTACSLVGLEQAVERQRERRQEIKRIKALQPEPYKIPKEKLDQL